MSHELSFHTWAAILYSSINGSWNTKRIKLIVANVHSVRFHSLLWNGIAADRLYWVKRKVHVPNTPATGFGDNSKTVNCSTVATLRCQFAPNSTDTEVLALCAATVHAKYSPTSRNRTPNAERVRPHRNGDAIQTYSCHAPCGSDSEPSC